MIAAGVDVGLRRSTVAMVEGDPTGASLLEVVEAASPEAVASVLAAHRPDVVAVDGPAGFSTTGANRGAERALARLGIAAHPCPPAERAGAPFFGWMHVSVAVHARAAAWPCIEVYPHGTVLRLAGPRPAGVGKHEWRRRALGPLVDGLAALRSPHAVDAAVAAWTGVLHLAGLTEAHGDDDGWIVLPRAAGGCTAARA